MSYKSTTLKCVYRRVLVFDIHIYRLISFQKHIKKYVKYYCENLALKTGTYFLGILLDLWIGECYIVIFISEMNICI